MSASTVLPCHHNFSLITGVSGVCEHCAALCHHHFSLITGVSRGHAALTNFTPTDVVSANEGRRKVSGNNIWLPVGSECLDCNCRPEGLRRALGRQTDRPLGPPSLGTVSPARQQTEAGPVCLWWAGLCAVRGSLCRMQGFVC